MRWYGWLLCRHNQLRGAAEPRTRQNEMLYALMSLMGQYKSGEKVRNQYSHMRHIVSHHLVTLLLTVSCAWARVAGAGETNQAPAATPLAHAQTVFLAALKDFANKPNDPAVVLNYARAGFERAEFSTNDTERSAIAVPCIQACRKVLARETNSAGIHYYLAMNLGQEARTKFLGALSIVDEMESEFKKAAALDDRFDYAGPQRNLGVLYFEAPVIGSVGSKTKARKHMERAVELVPDYPENRINLAEAYLKWRDKKPLQQEIEALEKLLPSAKTNLTGIQWESSWKNWQARWDKLNAKSKDVLNR